MDPAWSISPLTGLTAAGVVFGYEPGVPVFGSVPLPDPESITSACMGGPEIPGKPVRLEWFNGSKIGANLCHEQFLDKTEYMIKERWPSYLNFDYCTRLKLLHSQNVREPSPLSPHHWHEVFHRTQEQQLQREAFYFYRSKFERRFHFEMEG